MWAKTGLPITGLEKPQLFSTTVNDSHMRREINADSEYLFAITQNGTLSQHFVTHVVPPLSRHT